jgi:two-component system, NarL family, sensor kinase
MMRKIYFFLSLFLLASNLYAQRINSLDDDSKYIDSIENIVAQATSDSIKCLYSFRLSKLCLLIQNSEKAKSYLEKANVLAAKFPFLKDLSSYYNATKPLENGDIEGYEKKLIEANNILKKHQDKEAYKLRAVILQNYGILLQRKSDDKSYMELLINEAIPMAEKSEDKEITSGLYRAVGNILMNINDRGKADFYLTKAQELIEATTKQSATLIEAKLETYIYNANNLIELNQLPKAKILLDKSNAILSKYPKSNMISVFCYSEGLYFLKLNQAYNALASIERGIKSDALQADQLTVHRLKFLQYQVLSDLKKYSEAKEVLLNLVATNPLIIDRRNCFKELATTYHALNDTKNAYLFSQKYITLNDSLNKSKFENEIVTLEAKYNKTENEKKISILTAQKEKSELVTKNNRLFTWILALVLGFVLLLSGFLWKYYQNQKKLNIQKEINFSQQIKVLENEQNLAVSNALLQGEEMERKRLARDLHDGLGSMLSGLKLNFLRLPQSNATEVKAVTGQLDQAITELRQIAQNMMPESLLKLGLIPALKDLCSRCATKEISIEFQALDVAHEIAESKQIAVYRIVQELINNALKHANASEILVSCTQSATHFIITVEDNGKGFDVQKEAAYKTMGLKNIKNRVGFMKGKLEIASHPENGTVFNIELNITETLNANSNA